MKWWHVLFSGFCIFALLTVYNANAVSLSIPAAGSTLTESEYDSNNDLVETAVSELDAVDATKPAATRLTNMSTSFDSRLDAAKTEATFNTYSANEVTRNAAKANAANPALTGTGTFANLSGTGYIKILNGNLVVKGIDGNWYRLKATGAGFGKISTVAY